MIFLIPREGKTYIGTTDTFYNGDLKDPQVTLEDKNYLLKCVNEFCATVDIRISDIESQWAGLRPLINKKNDKPSEISRKDEMFLSASGLITIAGGKLTGYRKMAQRVVNKLSENILKTENRKISPCTTDNISLSGGKLTSTFTEFMTEKMREGAGLGLPPGEIKNLVYRYGSNINRIFLLMQELGNETDRLPLRLRAEVNYAINYEMCYFPSDFFLRRTGMMYFDIATVKEWKEEVFDYMRRIILWSPEQERKFRDDLQKQLTSF
jgi:glycerol-3-phosphate dehydrogenase